MEFQKNSTKILNLQSCGTNTNTNFMCNNCVRKTDSNYFVPTPFPCFQYHPTNFWGKMYQNEEISEQCNCQNSKSEYGLNGSFFSPFPIYFPVFYNPAAHMFTNNSYKQCSSNSNCSQSTQTDQCVSIQNNEIVYEKKPEPKLNYESTKKVYSRKSSFEDNRVGKSSHQLQDRGDNGAGDNENDIDESEYNSIINTKKDKFIRICEDKNFYYEKEKSSSEDDDDSHNENNDNENQIKNSTEKVKTLRNDPSKFCPPEQNETAALCMLSLLTRHKTAIDMAPPSLFQHPQTFPQLKSDGPTRVMKRPELKDSPSDNYLMSPARNSSIHKVPNALQQNDHLKSGSPRAPVKLRTNLNI